MNTDIQFNTIQTLLARPYYQGKLSHKITFSKNEDAAERVAQTSRDSSSCVRKRGLEAAIARVDEDNIRLRKKLDMVKYQSDKVEYSLAR